MRVSAGLTICRPLAKSLFPVQSSGSLAERIPITLSYIHIVNVVNTHAWYVRRRVVESSNNAREEDLADEDFPGASRVIRRSSPCLSA